MSTLPEDLAKMEYERLSKEIDGIQEEANQLARYAVIAAAAVCAAIVTTKDLPHRYILILKALPFITTSLFGFRVMALFKRMMIISVYFEQNFENKILRKEYEWLGWENYLNHQIRAKDSKHKRPRWSVGIFWFVLLAFTIIFIFL